MDGARDQFLAGAGLAADEDGGVALGHLADHAEHLFERAARADEAIEIIDVALRVAEVVDLVLHAAHLERLVDLDLHLLDFERLLHVIERAGPHGFDSRGDRSERGHQDDGGRRVQRLGGLQHVQPATAAHLQVAHDHVKEPLVELFNRGVAVGRLLDVVRRLRKRLREAPTERVVVVRDQNPAHVIHLPRCRLRAASRESASRALVRSPDRCSRRARPRSCGRWRARAQSPGAWS